MLKNPLIHALAASGYIILLVSAISLTEKPNTPDSFLTPIVMLSLFVLSASVMGYLFLYRPGELYFEGKRKEAMDFFLKTVGFFAGITVVLLILHASGVIV